MLVSFAFGELESATWGAGWFGDGERGTVLVSGESRPATLAREADGEEWRVAWEGGELVLAGAGDPVAQDGEALDQLCRVRAGPGQPTGLLGWRQRRPALPGSDWSSLRQAAAWFEPDLGIALTALRPSRECSHGKDQLSAALLGGGQAGRIEDPRLSTTYADDGAPTRAGVEVWLTRPAEAEAEAEELYPVRAAGQAAGPHVRWEQDGTTVSAQLFAWHSRGRQGAGAFLLARRG